MKTRPTVIQLSRQTTAARLLAAGVATAALAVAATAGAQDATTTDWPQWRGPHRDGSVPGARWPATLAGLEQLWRVELGKGYPGAIVTADAVFIVDSGPREEAIVRSLDRETGEQRWRNAWQSSGSVPFFAAANGDWVRSTPAWDGETLYVGDMREAIVALDGATGAVRWRFDAPSHYDTGLPPFGFASSPLVHDGALYVQAADSIVRLDARTGRPVWRALASSGGMATSGAFSSPVIATLAGVEHLVVLTRRELAGVDLGSGDVLWRQPLPNYRGMHIQTPVVWDDAIFTSPYRERSYLLKLAAGDDGPSVTEAWTNKATGYMSTPVVIDGHLYMHLANRRIECLDLATGQSRWRSERRFGKYWSMLHHGDSILALDEDGTLHLMRANPDRFELLDSREVSEQPAWGHLAASGDQIFVRELEAITAYRLGGR